MSLGRAVIGCALLGAAVAGCGSASHTSAGGRGPAPTVSPASAGPAASSMPSIPSTPASSASAATTSTLPPCALQGGGATQTVPVGSVCPSTGAPHFATPQAAMTYLAAAWNAGDVREVDYVTDTQGRAQLNAAGAMMPNLRLTSCTQNPAGDYTCSFTHTVVAGSMPMGTTVPGAYPPGEAVFTVAPAAGPGWYLTEVEHCD